MMPNAASRSRASQNGIWRSSVAVERDEIGRIEFRRPISRSRRGRNVLASSGMDGHCHDIFRRADQHGERGHGHRLDAGFAQAGDRQRAGALRQRLAGRRRQEIVVAEGRRLGAQRLEQRDLHAGIGDMVVAADDVGDAHVDVVGDGRQRVEIGAVLAHQDRIGQRGEVDRLLAAHQIVPLDLGALRSRTDRCGSSAAGSANAACGRRTRIPRSARG